MKILRLLIGVFVFFGISCSSPSEPADPDRITFILSEIPVIKGFYRTNVHGQIVGYIGQPPEPQNFPEGVKLTIKTARNNDSLEVLFDHPRSGNVLVVIAKARFLEQGQNTSVGGAVISGSQKIIVRTLVNQRLQGGKYTVLWDGKDDDGRKVISGFYRIYYVTKNFTVWGDTFYARNPGDKPPFIP